MTFIYYCLQICGHRKRLLIKYEVDTIAASRHFAICTLIGKLVGSISSRTSEAEKIGWDLRGIYAKLVGMTRRRRIIFRLSPLDRGAKGETSKDTAANYPHQFLPILCFTSFRW